MMRHLLTLAVLLVPVLAIPLSSDFTARILRQDQDVQPDGSYQYSYDTENGISAQEEGHPLQISPEETAEQVQGSFQYNSPEGPVALSYVANEFGFQPSGTHLPTPPPVPAGIQRALAFIASVESKSALRPFREANAPKKN